LKRKAGRAEDWGSPEKKINKTLGLVCVASLALDLRHEGEFTASQGKRRRKR
jgi:hypothetical protein